MSVTASFVPDDFVVPRSLVTEAFRLEPLGPEHNEGDYAAWHVEHRPHQVHPGHAGPVLAQARDDARG